MASQICLYIEDQEIKILTTKGRIVEKWASLTLEPGLVSEGVIINEDAVAGKIKEILELQKIKETRVIAALSGLNSIFRILTLPELPSSLVNEAVYNEANRVIPLPLDQVHLGYQVIDSSPGETRIFVVAFPRASLEALTSTLRKAGLDMRILDIAPLALCRCADAPKSIIVNSWLNNVDIAIVVDKVPLVIRSMTLPTDSTELADKLPTLAEEFNRTVSFYNSSYSDDKLDDKTPVFVCGDLATEPDAWPELIGGKENPVSVLPSAIEAPEFFMPSGYMVPIGLALKEMPALLKDTDCSIVNFDALPRAQRTTRINWVNVVAPIVIVAALLGVGWGWYYVQDMKSETTDLNTQLNDLQNQITEEQPGVSLLHQQITDTQASLDPLAEKEKALYDNVQQLAKSREIVVEDIRDSIDLRNDQVTAGVELFLTELLHDDELFIVSGVTPNEDDIFEYARDLRNSGRYSQVIVTSVTQKTLVDEDENEEEVYEFDFLLYAR